MKTVKRSRSKDLDRVIISKTILKHLWASLERHAVEDARAIEHLKKAKPNSYFSDPDRPIISISSAGGITTEADDGAILDNDVLDTLKTKSVMLSYSSFSQKNKSIRIRFEEDESLFSSGTGYFSVSANDVAWVDATFADLERIASAIPPQSTWFQNWRWLIVIAFALTIGSIFAELIHLLSSPDKSPSPHWIAVAEAHPPLMLFFRAVVLFCIGYFPAEGLASWVGRIWPAVEFDFGPEHFKNRKKIRARISAVVILVALPLLLEAFQRFGLGWR